MKKSWLVLLVSLSVQHVFSQVKIDDQYKNPGKTNSSLHLKTNIAETASESVLKSNIALLKKNYAPSEYEQKMKVADAEMKAFNINGDEVWLYEDMMYGGRKKILKAGKYTLKNLGIYWNDRFSSMLVPRNLAVILYSDDAFGGMKDQYKGYGIRQCMHCYSTEQTVLTYDYGNFNTMGLMLNSESTTWNDVASSIEIVKN